MLQPKRLMATEDINHQCKKVTLKEFSQQKQELEERIAQLYALADKVDKVHRRCTISNVVSRSTSTVSGILTIVGLSLAPVTGGASLVFRATGAGLRAAAAVTRISTSIAEDVENQSARDKARRLVPTDINKQYMVQENKDQRKSEMEYLAKSCFKSLQNMVENMNAYKWAKANCSLVAKAEAFMSTGNISDESSKELQAAFRGAVLAVKTETKRSVGINAVPSFLADVMKLAREAKHLDEGAKAQLAEELRRQARELESELKKLTQAYKTLQEAELEPPQRAELLSKQLHLQREYLMSSMDDVDKGDIELEAAINSSGCSEEAGGGPEGAWRQWEGT
ncbi:apolipoprotein L6-like [Phyllostomus hastatus]|uniref:apolipoprotein L6-like n=1 Tax=Phyllostomus hastatus TaxID=9423 RepID=UPI001E684471|nr:apolipoprotein L6-like [Phyllostomus hastatus]